MVAMASAVTTKKPDRQPSACPIQLATGTPSTVAMVRPDMTRAIACARFSIGTNFAATKAATPK